MHRNTGNTGRDSVATIASGLAVLQGSLTEHTSPEQFCHELAKVFQVQSTEVALLQLEAGCLRFLFPPPLRTAGSIPVSSSSAIAARTASSKKSELYNNFAKIKHASIFETVKLGSPEENSTFTNPPIQKLMSAPVLDDEGNVLAVIQLCRKGYDLHSCGPDFSLEHLHHLERAARITAKAAFLRKRSSTAANQ